MVNATAKLERLVLPRALEDMASFFGMQPSEGRIAARLLRAIEALCGISLGVRLREPLPEDVDASFWYAYGVFARLAQHSLFDTWRVSSVPPVEADSYIYSLHKQHVDGAVSGVGVHAFSRGIALLTAIGELIERSALEFYVPEYTLVRDVPESALSGDVIDLTKLAGISDERRRAHTHCNMAFDAETSFRWICGRSLTNGRPTWVPLQLATFSHARHVSATGAEPLLRASGSNGAAAHPKRVRALLHGLQELIEREAFMVTWTNMLSPSRVVFSELHDPRIRALVDKLLLYGIETHCVYLPTDFPIHAVLVILIGRGDRWPAVTVGASARNNLDEAVLKALTEAHGCRIWAHTVADKRGSRTIDEAAVSGIEERLLWWAAAERLPDIQFLLEGPLVHPSQIPREHHAPAQSPKKELEILIEHCRSTGIEVCAVDITPQSIRAATGFTATIVIAPALQPLHLDGHISYEDGSRMYSIPTLFGLTRSYPNPLLHPFP